MRDGPQLTRQDLGEVKIDTGSLNLFYVDKA